VFVLKFHTIARYQLSAIFKKCKPQSELCAADAIVPSVPAAAAPANALPAAPPATPLTQVPFLGGDKQGEKDKEDKQTFQVTDCRSLVKTLVCGVKTITWGITSCKAPGGNTFTYTNGLQCIVCCLFFSPPANICSLLFCRGSVCSQQAAPTQRDADLY
ncbi:hypothetical protein FKM82_003028, partial [Ascaphus truei]